MNRSEIESKICDFLKSNILEDSVSIDTNLPLRELGVDSFALMEVILFFERSLDITFPLEELTPENAKTINSLSTCFEKVLNNLSSQSRLQQT